LLRTFAANITGVATAAFSPDGKNLITSGLAVMGPSSAATRLWDVSSGQEVRVFDFGPYIDFRDLSSIVAFSPDGNRVVVMNGTDSILFDINTGQEVCDFVGHLAYVTSVAYSSDGKYTLTGSQDKTARLWDARTCQQLRLFTDNASIVTAVAFSPDGKYVLTGHYDSKARLWDAATGTQLREFQGHTYWIKSVGFSPNGRYVLTGSADGTARLWDTDYHDTMQFACSLLWRDLTAAEREQYSIPDKAPTCPKP
jgi:WD40 repeat protein